jgi:hypothetical protein
VLFVRLHLSQQYGLTLETPRVQCSMIGPALFLLINHSHRALSTFHQGHPDNTIPTDNSCHSRMRIRGNLGVFSPKLVLLVTLAILRFAMIITAKALIIKDQATYLVIRFSRVSLDFSSFLSPRVCVAGLFWRGYRLPFSLTIIAKLSPV